MDEETGGIGRALLLCMEPLRASALYLFQSANGLALAFLLSAGLSFMAASKLDQPARGQSGERGAVAEAEAEAAEANECTWHCQTDINIGNNLEKGTLGLALGSKRHWAKVAFRNEEHPTNIIRLNSLAPDKRQTDARQWPPCPSKTSSTFALELPEPDR